MLISNHWSTHRPVPQSEEGAECTREEASRGGRSRASPAPHPRLPGRTGGDGCSRAIGTSLTSPRHSRAEVFLMQLLSASLGGSSDHRSVLPRAHSRLEGCRHCGPGSNPQLGTACMSLGGRLRRGPQHCPGAPLGLSPSGTRGDLLRHAPPLASPSPSLPFPFSNCFLGPLTK